MKRFVVILFSFIGTLYSQNLVKIGSTSVTIDTLISGMDVPWELIYGPDEHLWVTERKGIVSRIDPILKTKTVILDLTDTVHAVAESGMLGMAMHPDFPATPQVFLVYDYQSGTDVKVRLSRFDYINSMLVHEVVLIDGIVGGNAHNGSRLLFLPDKTLLMTTGDGDVAGVPQNKGALNGKVLRVNTDGSIPADNPFPGKYIYTFGHRNSQGMCYGPNGKIYISEHGTTTDDEFQQLEAGRNYGWPDVQGYCDLPSESAFCTANNVKEPILDWTPTIAPAGIIFYTNNNFPEFDNSFLLTTLKSKKLVAIKLNAAGTASVSQTSYLENMFGRLRDVCYGKQGEVYLATNGPEAWNTEPGTHSILVIRTPLPGSVKRIGADQQVLLYPTAVTDKLTIETASVSNLEISIYSLLGVSVFSKSIQQASASVLSLEELAAGVYVVDVRSGDSVLAKKKIVVTR